MSHMSYLDIVTRRDADTDEGCADCGATDCTCDTHCADCGRPYRDEDEQERGQCDMCYGEALDAQRDEVGR